MSTSMKNAPEQAALHSQLAEGLSRVLADTYSIYLKDPEFSLERERTSVSYFARDVRRAIHRIAMAIDEIAERIRAIGFPAPGSFTEFSRLSRISEANDLPSADKMISILIADQATIVQTAKDVFPLAQQANDEPTTDLLIRRIQIHEKTAWMLRSLTE